MRHKRFYFSIYTIVPVIFAGIAFLSTIVSYQISKYYTKIGIDTGWSIYVWAAVITALAFFCGLMLARLLLKPVEKFVKKTKNLPALAGSEPDNSKRRPRDDLEHFSYVFKQITDVLSKIEARQLFPEIIGQSVALRGILNHIMKVSPTDSTVLISGESGTGKEIMANSIYENSLRKHKPFIKINCVAIPEGLIESELFGHEKGAFTGATAKKIGKFEIANGGTIFMDEIGDMPLNTQAKILRVLQEKEFERVGGTQTINVDVRFIVATNKNLEKMVKEGQFRDDLYYRLNVFPLHLPSLRDRKEDIPLLVDHFLKNAPKSVQISSMAVQVLMAYLWPGNVRELQNTVERAAVMCENGIIETHHLPDNIKKGLNRRQGDMHTLNESLSIDDQLSDIERGMITEALRKAGGVQVRTAELLGINQRSLWHRIKKYNIDVQASKINNI